MNEHSIGSIDDLSTDKGTKVAVGTEEIAVFRVDDQVYAIADQCSHAEASLADGELFGFEVECPRHGAEFDITDGSNRSLPATKPVTSYPAKVVAGEVFITIGSENADV
jgi:3-phenylpropionate/trans-cinnamate dioxygenase ferredoxin subunit